MLQQIHARLDCSTRAAAPRRLPILSEKSSTSSVQTLAALPPWLANKFQKYLDTRKRPEWAAFLFAPVMLINSASSPEYSGSARIDWSCLRRHAQIGRAHV